MSGRTEVGAERSPKPSSLFWPTLGLCAAAGALAATVPAALFFSTSKFRLYSDYVLLLLYFGSAAALGATGVAVLPALILRRRARVLSFLPDLCLGAGLFLYPLTAVLSEEYLIKGRLNPLHFGGAAWGRLILWCGIAAASAFGYRRLRRWWSGAHWNRGAMALVAILAFHAAYFALRSPKWRNRSVHDPALNRYPHAVSSRPGSRLLVLCLDGADWQVVDPLLREGRLPRLAALIREGTRAELRGEVPYSSHTSWTSIFTGKRPDRHGIKGHLMVDLPGVSWTRVRYQDRDNFVVFALGSLILELGLVEAPPIASTFLKVKPVWKVLSDHGRSVWVLGVPSSWPAFPVRGAMVTDRVGYSVWEAFYRHRDRPDRATHPASLLSDLGSAIVRPTDVRRSEIARFYDPTDADWTAVREDEIGLFHHDGRVLFNRTYCMDRTVLNSFHRLCGREDLPDVAVVYLTGMDLAAHAFYQHKHPEKFPAGLTAPEEIRRFGRVVDRYWEYVDEELGRVLDRYGQSDTVLVVSDHGIEPAPHHPTWNTAHGARGVFAIRGPGIRTGAQVDPVSLYEITPLLYHLAGFPVPDDGDGKLREELFSTPVTKLTIPSYD